MTAAAPTPVRSGHVPLRVTLVALLVALVALALLATGFATTSLLRDYLTDEQDDALRSAVSQVGVQEYRACREGGYSSPGPRAAYYGCYGPGADEVVDLQGPRDPDAIPTIDPSRMDDARYRHSAVTVRAEDGTSWRLMTGQLPEGYTLVVGIDLEDDEKAISRLVRIELFVGLAVLTVLGVAGYLLVRNSLRPLAEVERTARAIAAGDLSQRVPEGDQRTEVGRLSTALNGMLARIESAFRAQQASEAEARGSEEKMRRFVADGHQRLGLAQRLLGLLDHLLLLGEQVDHRSAVLAGLLQPLDGRALECDDALVLELLRVDLGPLGVDLGDGHLGEVHGVLLGLFLGVPLLKHTRSCEYNFS